ncbi:hypothetical protein V8C34DRAFT_284524 [Trichoderma compactum]
MKLLPVIYFVSFYIAPSTATWCFSNANTCPIESYKGQATKSCCDKINVHNHDRGCWVEGELWSRFRDCCIHDWGCSGVSD